MVKVRLQGTKQDINWFIERVLKNNNEVKNKRKNPVLSFLKTVTIILVCFLGLSFVAVYAYTKATFTPENGYEEAPKVTE